MKAEKGINLNLNKVLADQLIAINQYFLHARMFKNEGLEVLNKKDYKQSILKMKQADWLIERILLLEGLPNLQKLGRLRIGETPKERLEANMEFELESVALIKETIKMCEAAGDYVSRELLEKLQVNEEEQIDWLEGQMFIIENAGIENYLQSQM
ncbi:MAG: bacterioferritin [Alteromonadaceae bacterium]|jgi:bacterioferritin